MRESETENKELGPPQSDQVETYQKQLGQKQKIKRRSLSLPERRKLHGDRLLDLKLPERREPQIDMTESLKRPHGSSYYLPGKVGGKPALFLLDTGCNTNLISKRMFDQLPQSFKQQLKPCTTHGQLADGSRLPFYGVAQLPGRLRDMKFEETFVVSSISEDGILGMPFLADHGCKMDFGQPTITIQDLVMPRVDRYGRLLQNKVQLVRSVEIPARSEMTVQCRITTRNYYPVGIVESGGKIPLATSLNQPHKDGRIVVRCMNPLDQPLRIPAGKTVGMYTGIEENDIEMPEVKLSQRAAVTAVKQEVRSMWVPKHLQQVYEDACHGCRDEQQRRQLACLLIEYSQVFSTTDDDVGQTTLVEHSVPIIEGARPIHQPPHRLGPQKEAEAERQIQELLSKGLIEPASGA
ncbi:uncharacterized protein [Watersipora subatra]|uniref:uncharacterized protein n=1 Tax=Watersipora subatra TaxID=2589382 RepID=UPI00355BB598